MGVLQVLLIATSALLVLENGSPVVECAPSGTYSYTMHHRSSSSNNAISPVASRQRSAVPAARSYRRSELSDTDYRKYLPVEDTPEVKKAREQFFTLYEKQAKLAAEAEDNDLDGTYTQSHVAVGTKADAASDYDYYYYDDEEGEEDDDEYEGDDDEEEEEDSDEEDEDDEEEDDDDDDDEEEDDDDDDDDDDDEEDSDEDEESEEDSDEYGDDSSSSSSSSEEDYYGDDSSEEDGDDSSSEESSEEQWGEEDSSSSSSSSSEEDGDGVYSPLSLRTTSRGRYQPLNTNALVAPKAVTDTPEVKQAKRDFFDLYKTQAELSFNAADDR